MDIKKTRKIERYVGVPICFLLTIVYRTWVLLKRLFRIKHKQKNPEAICFIELSEMGSIVLAASAMIKAKEMNPGAKLYFLTFEKNKVGIETLNIIPKGNILTMRGEHVLSLGIDTIRFMFTARKLKIDTIIDFELFSRYTAMLSFLSGAEKRVGFSNYTNEGLYRGGFMTHNVIYNSHQHMSKNFLAQVYSINENSTDNDGILLKREIPESDIIYFKKKISEKEKNSAWNLLHRFNKKIGKRNKIIIMNPNAGEQLPIRSWPVENYISLSEALLQEGNVYILLIGVGKEAENVGRKMTEKINNNRMINLINKTSFNDMMDLFYISDVLLTNDSGPAHFATLSDIKIITFFGPETPKLYGPISRTAYNLYSNFSCSPCLTAYNYRHTVCKNNRCLQKIKVYKVHSLIKKLLRSGQEMKDKENGVGNVYEE